MGLQIHQHEAFQRREWRAQRIGWVLVLLFVLAALAGLLGGGPWSWSTATTADGQVQVHYERFAHLEADDQLTVTVSSEAVTGDSVDVEIAEGWLRAVDVDGIVPEPMEQVTTPYGLRLTMSAEPGTDLRIRIYFRATDLGKVDAGVRFEGDTATFGQLIYP